MCVCALDPKLELDALGAAQGWSNRPQFAAVHMSLAGTERRASKLPWPLRFHSGLRHFDANDLIRHESLDTSVHARAGAPSRVAVAVRVALVVDLGRDDRDPPSMAHAALGDDALGEALDLGRSTR